MLPSVPKCLIVHGCYHKVMTVYFKRSLEKIARELGLPFYSGAQKGLPFNQGIFLQDHSDIHFNHLPDFRGTHVIRDPRDMLISGYFYHLRATEPWCLEKAADGLSYQDRLNAFESQEEGILFELHGSSGNSFQAMAMWPYGHEGMLELRYEDLIHDADHRWKYVIFEHYGFRGSALDRCVEIMAEFSFESVSGRKVGEEDSSSHARKGMPGDWKNFFTDNIKSQFKARFGGLLVNLGYEKNLYW